MLPFIPALLVTATPYALRREGFLLSVPPRVTRFIEYDGATPDDSYFYRLGLKKSADGNDEAALQAFRRAEALAPSEIAHTNNVAVALLRLGSLDEALLAARRAVASSDPAIRIPLHNLKLIESIQRTKKRRPGDDHLFCYDEDKHFCAQAASDPNICKVGFCPRTCGFCGGGFSRKAESAEVPDFSHLDLGDKCDFALVDARDITPRDFAEQFVTRRTPAIINNLMDGWPAWSWFEQKDNKSMVSTYVGDRLARAIVFGKNEYVNIDRLDANKDTDIRGQLKEGIGQSVKKLFGIDLLGVTCAPDLPKRWVLFSAAGSGSPWHVDPLNSSAYNCLLRGSKRWAVSKGIPPLHHSHDWKIKEYFNSSRDPFNAMG